jgi:hypothetical protein
MRPAAPQVIAGAEVVWQRPQGEPSERARPTQPPP